MNFPDLPIADLPPVEAAPLAAEVGSAVGSRGPAAAPHRISNLPLAQRLTLNPTISARANYYDLANTRRAPHDLRTALIWLCLCAHDNKAWWTTRAADHRDGEDPPPLPLKLDFAAWGCYIDDWAAANIRPDEEAEAQGLALRVWLHSQETAVVPAGDEEAQKKTEAAASRTGLSSTSAPSPGTIPPPPTSCSTGSPSATPTPASTHGSPPAESSASPPPNPPAETLRSTS